MYAPSKAARTSEMLYRQTADTSMLLLENIGKWWENLNFKDHKPREGNFNFCEGLHSLKTDMQPFCSQTIGCLHFYICSASKKLSSAWQQDTKIHWGLEATCLAEDVSNLKIYQ